MSAEWRRYILRDVLRALPATSYEVRLVTQSRDESSGKCIKTIVLNAQDFIAHHAQFGRWSAQQLHVFFRPVGGPKHVLLDLDTPDVLDEVLDLAASDGLRPSLVNETSPGRNQLWFTLSGRDRDPDVHRAACKLLAQRYGADPGSAKPTQLGRVPGTMNPKPSQAKSDGAPPFVKRVSCGQCYGTNLGPSYRPSERLLLDAQARAEDVAARVSDVPIASCDLSDHGVPEDELQELFVEVVARHDGDRSRADFTIALLARQSGDSPERAVSLILAGSTKARELEDREAGSGRAYAERTVRNAWLVANTPPENCECGSLPDGATSKAKGIAG